MLTFVKEGVTQRVTLQAPWYVISGWGAAGTYSLRVVAAERVGRFIKGLGDLYSVTGFPFNSHDAAMAYASSQMRGLKEAI